MKRAFLALLAGVVILSGVADAKEIKVKSYTKKDGTKVEGYTKTVKDSDTVKVKRYTKKDGTKVKSYKRKKASH